MHTFTTKSLLGLEYIESTYGYQLIATNHKFVFVGLTEGSSNAKQSIGYLLGILRSKISNVIDPKYDTVQLYLTGLKTRLPYLFVVLFDNQSDVHMLYDTGTSKVSQVRYTTYTLYSTDCLQYQVLDYRSAILSHRISNVPFIFAN